MLINSSHTIELYLAGSVSANQLEFVAYGEDVGGAPYLNNGTSNGTTDVTVVASPDTGVLREVHKIAIYNSDTVAATVTVQLNNGSADRRIIKAALAAGESAIYVKGDTWRIFTASGEMLKSIYDPAGVSEQLVGLTATQTLTNKTLTSPDINGGTVDSAVIGGSTPATGSFTTGSFSSDVTVTGDHTVSGLLGLGAPTELTIASGVVTATKSYHKVDTESDAGTDDLATINGGSDGDILILQSVVNTKVTTVKDGAGNIRLAGGDFVLSHQQDKLMLINVTGTVWEEISRSDNI